MFQPSVLRSVKSRHDEHDANDVDHTLADLVMSSHARLDALALKVSQDASK